ncbi:multiprotein-bridging factor 1 family protein [Streptomyces sp. NPDC004286]|uniref:helix-turn-helix domain-containing protein n=1 Tax=Streptomyces sp. NPDC004286 TaxID=3364696 RepID=UPI0036C8EBEC
MGFDDRPPDEIGGCLNHGRGLSQRELAQASKVSHSLITKLEHGPGDPGAR